ncbi:LysR family transcriptional regulator [Amphritea balenae]|uniref:LysR family transcriptional regulator n=1 Tax=Amphritea balenae TaxID=452629 RepID=A0A3P1SWR3_9GAMM|nr:LysR family transcriptional regulator [Amphritea balenae]RRD01570.1 LysR family transcriptional regulator [Amphritea balenae]GGK55820.1 LysR family transcriptional regulator [Amphritea balenae]
MSLKAEYLKALIATEHKGSLSAAAAELGITVSSVSYAIRQLEDELGESLLNRDNYRVSLTEAGQAAAKYGTEILRLHSSLIAEVNHIAHGWEQELRIVFTNMLRSEVLFNWIGEFYRLNTGTRIRVIREVYSGTWDALYDQRADLVIGAIGRPPHEVDTHSVPIGRRDLSLAMAVDHPLADLPEPLTMEQLNQYRQIDAGDSSRLIDSGLNSHRFSASENRQEQLIVPDLFAQKEAILSGIGVGFLPLHMIENDIVSGQIKVREVLNRDSSLELFTCWRQSSRGKALEWFTQRLLQQDYRQEFL